MRDPMMECDKNKKEQNKSKRVKIYIGNGVRPTSNESGNCNLETNDSAKNKDIRQSLEDRENSEGGNKLADFNSENHNNAADSNRVVDDGQIEFKSSKSNDCEDKILWICNFIDINKSTFNESNRNILYESLEELKVDLSSDSQLLALINALSQLTKTSYFYFLSSSIYPALLKLLNSKVKCQIQTKVLAFEFLNENYDTDRLFKTIMEMYNSIDSSRIGRRSFRNYAAHRLLENIFNSIVATDASKIHEVHSQVNADTVKDTTKLDFFFDKRQIHFLLELSECLNHCIPFAEFLSRNTDDALCCTFMLIYTYSFLGKIKEDLMNIKKIEEIKNVEENIIAKIFLRMNEILHFYKKDENAKYSCILKTLYKSNNLRSVVLTVLKRLFNFFSIKNKRLLNAIKVPKIFNKKEKDFLHRNLKDHTLAYTNVFKQLDYRYLLKLMHKIQVSDKSSSLLLENINQDQLDEVDLVKFYDFYSKFIDYWKSSIKSIKIKHMDVFARLFNRKIDKTFIRFVTFNSVASYESEEVIEMIATYFYMIFYLDNRLSHVFDKTVDVVELVSRLADTPSNLQIGHKTRYYNNILKILYFMTSSLNKGLIGRIFPILCKLTFHSDYSLNAGRLYRKILDLFKLENRLFEIESVRMNDFILLAKASVGDPSFEQDYKINLDKNQEILSTKDSQNTVTSENNQPEDHKHKSRLMQGILDNSVISYLYYNSSFAMNYKNELRDILRRKNKSTISLLEYFLYVTGSNEELNVLFSFISVNITEFYALYNFQLDKSDDHGISKNEYAANNNKLAEMNENEEKDTRKLFIIQHNPFENLILGIFFNSLKIKAVLPCMVIPYLIPKLESGFLHRNHADSCVNCINDTIRLIACRIIGHCEKKTDNVIEMGFLKKLFIKENPVFFLYDMSSYSSIRKILEKIDYQNDFLFVFIVIWHLKPFSRKEKDKFFKHIEENVSEEKIFDLIKKSKSFYEKNSKETLPLDFII